MTDAEWSRGWGELTVAYPQRDEASEQAALRAGLYRKHLDDLDPRAWLHAVSGSIRECTFFPAVAELRAHADAWRAPMPPALPPSEEEREEARAQARRGLEMVKAAVAEREQAPVPEAVKAMPRALDVTEERLEFLRRQAKEIAS